MKRFPPDMRLDVITAESDLDVDMAAAVGRAAARLHLRAERCPDHGGSTGMRRVIEQIRVELGRFPEVFDQDVQDRLSSELIAVFRRQATLLEIRRVDGWVRECADPNAAPNLNRSCVDVVYDLALLIANLLHRDLRAHANAVLNGWMERLRQYDALPVLPLFLSSRAAARAATLAAGGAHDDARACLSRAVELLQPATGAIIAIGGGFGAGKTTLARRLASQLGCAPGALVLSSDAARSRLFGSEDGGPKPAYDPSVVRSVYRLLGREARDVTRAGYVAVLDAVFGSDDWRRDMHTVAVRAGVPFVGIWLVAPAAVLERRAPGQRRAIISPPGDWVRIDASLDVDAVAAAALAVCPAPQAGV